MKEDYAVEMLNITKRYFGVTALNDVELKIKKSSIHALIGENGAGKSTLMKILGGIEKPDKGKILLDGKEVKFKFPIDSLNNGISMIQQELDPIPEMTIAENLFLGREFHYKGGLIINSNMVVSEAEKILATVGMNINPRYKMKRLTVAQIQMVEIAKAVSFNAKVIIMDEPTSALTQREVESLFSIVRKIKENGSSVIFISHKLDELFKVCDEITILRDGNFISNCDIKDITVDEVIRKMVNREIKEMFPVRSGKIGEVVLNVKNYSEDKKFTDINFKVHAGEILGIAGLMGAGRTETVESIFGITKADKGEIEIDGKRVVIKKPADAIKEGIGLITEDRKMSGLILPLSVKENIVLPSLRKLSKFKGILNQKLLKKEASHYAAVLNIKIHNINQGVNTLSGGNQQKVVLAKWLLLNPKILIFDEPTRGIDIGAKTEFYHLISELATNGVSIVFISSELEEVLGMSDRIIVFHEGEISGELSRKEATQEKIMQLATGSKMKEA